MASSEQLPESSGSPADEYRAALEGCALVDHGDRDQIELTGGDRTTFLHNFCTQDVKGLKPGQGAEAFVTNIKGRIVGHVLVFVGEDSIVLDGPAGTAAALIPHFDHYLISEDVQLLDRSSDWGELGLIGPRAAHIVDALVPGGGTFAPLQHASVDGLTVRRFDFTRESSWLILSERPALAGLWERLRQAGATPCSVDVFNALRIEAGFPQYGVDLSEENLAHEAARKEQAISFIKGCYLGQEPIARLEALGHTNRELRGLRLEGEEVPAPGARVAAVDPEVELGQVSSSALNPLDGHAVALAMLRRQGSEPGAQVRVSINGAWVGAVVADVRGG